MALFLVIDTLSYGLSYNQASDILIHFAQTLAATHN